MSISENIQSRAIGLLTKYEIFCQEHELSALMDPVNPNSVLKKHQNQHGHETGLDHEPARKQRQQTKRNEYAGVCLKHFQNGNLGLLARMSSDHFFAVVIHLPSSIANSASSAATSSLCSNPAAYFS